MKWNQYSGTKALEQAPKPRPGFAEKVQWRANSDIIPRAILAIVHGGRVTRHYCMSRAPCRQSLRRRIRGRT